jgi:oligoendopeptidase F
LISESLEQPIGWSKILSYGGWETPIKILTEAGLDISSLDFWQGGFDTLENMVVELERLS